MVKKRKESSEAGLSRQGGQMGFDWRAGPVEEADASSTVTDIPPEPPVPTGIEPDASTPAEPEVADAESVADGPAYHPNHPWHYYPLGDNMPPVPFEDIPASASAGRALAEDMPKAPAKRMVRVRELLESERRELTETGERYRDVVERGAAALSGYDRTIAHGGNEELARASTLAILYNRVAWHRGRLEWLERASGRGGTLGL